MLQSNEDYRDGVHRDRPSTVFSATRIFPHECVNASQMNY